MAVTNETIMVTVEQLKDMKHTIGFSLDRCKKKKGQLTYTAFRNYFDAGKGGNTSLDLLVYQGFMTKKEVSELWGGGIWYYVSQKGFEYIEAVTGVKIEEMEN